MRILSVTLTALSAILIAAHFYRGGSYVLAAMGLIFPAILLFRSRAAVRTVQVLLLVAAAEWVRTAAVLALERQAMGQPWLRMALILGLIAAISAASALLLERAERRKTR